MRKKVVMIVLDGWGIGAQNATNPIYSAHPKTFEYLDANFPVGSLQASGISVGLPWSDVGNSEVGHLTLGAGKVIYQYYPKITMSIRDGTLPSNPAIAGAFSHAKKNGARVHLIGLLTSATTHASLEHLNALLAIGEEENVPVNMHVFADAIDGPPYTLEALLEKVPHARLATLTGRYYAMDRNQNWQLIERTYNAIVRKVGENPGDLHAYIESFYKKNLTEEFIPPLVIDEGKCIRDGDAVFFFNFREDGIRELSEVFALKDFDKFKTEKFQNLYVATMTQYEARYDAPVAFTADTVEQPLAKALSDAGKNQLHIAETYKYAHVTYFFNGYTEQPFKNEYRVLIPSLNTTHPEEHPELMASAITDRVVEAIQSRSFDFILANYSNPDTIAHTGNYDACLKAVGIIDGEIAKIISAIDGTETVLIITSDHGNIEEVINPSTGRIETQHDSNPVPIYVISDEFKGKKFANWQGLRMQTTGILSDVAPTILQIMGIPKPPQMTGHGLLSDIINVV